MRGAHAGLASAQVDLLVKIVHHALDAETAQNGQQSASARVDLSLLDEGEFLRAAREHRVEQLLSNQGTAVGIPSRVVDELQELSIESSLQALTLATELTRIWAAFDHAGIRSCTFKGVALSQLTTASLTARGAGDMDFLLEEADLLAAADLLIADGWQLDGFTQQQLHDWWPWIRWSIRAITLNGPRAQLDIHWHLAKERSLLPGTTALLHRSEEMEIAGDRVLTLSRHDSLMAACYHLHHDRYRSLRQVIDVSRLLRGQVNPVVGTKRDLAVTRASSSLAFRLLGGPSAQQFESTGLQIHNIQAQRRQWDRNRLYPLSGRPATSSIEQIQWGYENYRYGRIPVEFARLLVSYALARPESLPHDSGPLTLSELTRSIAGHARARIRRGPIKNPE
ncbi:MAG: nucleotidyltransferase family protein [Actinomycetota bacterium]|nr:nucleotidyltransferase family protein [Actinomycetota bacterium]